MPSRRPGAPRTSPPSADRVPGRPRPPRIPRPGRRPPAVAVPAAAILAQALAVLVAALAALGLPAGPGLASTAATLRAQEAEERPEARPGAGGEAGEARDQESEGTEPPPSIEERTRDMVRLEGFFNLYRDTLAGTVHLEIDRWEEPFLYQTSLATGLGSNPVGLDRGQLGDTRILVARRVGPRVLLVQPNQRYRARTEDRAERRAVREAFAPSVIWGFEVEARTGERVLVDATDFFFRDAHDVTGALKRADQGSFELEPSRSALHLPRTAAFPDNTEVETSLTFTSDEPGPLVRATAADGRAVTLRQHHSFVRLPGPGYEPRRADPRVGVFGITFHDYAAPIDGELEVRWIARHRLERRDSASPSSPAVRPLVYHVDRGIPEPVRSAVLEGARWWEEAFRVAGFEDAFRVELLPEGADPMDLRYNVILWTHRRTRGWSYGSSVVDPRTGEILKANVNLGSLRLRQDHLLGRGLLPPYGTAGAGGGEAGRHGADGPGGRSPRAGAAPVGDGWHRACDLGGGPDFGYLAAAADGSPVELALARVRQLSAHEVGHTLGLAHNFAASTYGRASVMDYPAPLVRIGEDGALDLSDAYDVGVGAYDRFAIRWAYSDFAPGVDRKEALDAIVREGLADGMVFLSDADARPAGAAHPLAALWDNGRDPARSLRHEIEVRRRGLEAFGPGAIRPGEPLAALEEVLVPLYLHHRYQVEATSHALGGLDYRFALRGDGQTPLAPVAGGAQRAALEAMLATLEPSFLDLPERILSLLPPRAYGMAEGETFRSRTSPAFDLLGVAASTAELTLDFLLQSERMARLVEQRVRHPELPGLAEVLDRLMAATWDAPPAASPRRAALRRVVERSVLERLLEEADRPANPAPVRALLALELEELAERLERAGVGDTGPAAEAHRRAALRDLRRWLRRTREQVEPEGPRELPPGSPIGGGR